MTTNIKKESKEEVLDKKFIENSLKTLGRRFGVNEAFRDVVTCIAYSFANVVDMKEEREKEYLRIINKYEEDERNLFSKILVEILCLFYLMFAISSVSLAVNSFFEVILNFQGNYIISQQ